jgi:hypothetical protein
VWEESELPEDCHFRPLTPLIGDAAPCGRHILPIERDRARIEDAVRSHNVVVVRAATGSGKTMKIPEFMSNVLNDQGWSKMWPILVVEQNVFAAAKVVDDLVEVFHWQRRQIQLRTGKHDEDKFVRGETVLSVITYGILWRWITGHEVMEKDAFAGHDSPIHRYAGIFLDEFVDLSPKKE